MIKPTAHVPHPKLEWRDDTPVSTAFDDVYFSRAGGIAETEHVFLRGNGLPERWTNQNINGHGNPCVALYGASPQGEGLGVIPPSANTNKDFTIAELGFGTGLNFLVTLKAFRATAARSARLNYIAIEKYPFTPEQLRELLAHHPELANEAEELIAAYPLRLPGIHRVHLGHVSLTLCFGDVEEMLAELEQSELTVRSALWREPRSGRGYPAPVAGVGDKVPFSHPFVNAWYLDGFSPAKNSDMWSEKIYQQMRRLSAPEATFATFTAASHVRRGLEAVGFTVTKTQGFGHKREMLVGVMSHQSSVAIKEESRVESRESNEETYSRAVVPPPIGGRLGGGRYLSPSEQLTPPPQPSPCGGGSESSSLTLRTAQTSIFVVGGGIAGATLARALAERGYRVTLLERGAVASGASGNAAGVLFPQITKQWGGASAWYFTAYGFALRQLIHWQAQGLRFEHAMCGMLRLPRHAEEEYLLQHLAQTHEIDASIVHWLDREAASAVAGVALQTGAAFFPQGTWLNPAALCAALLQHENITVNEKIGAESLTREGSAWRITTNDGGVYDSDICCITAAHETGSLLGEYGITLGCVGGQVSLFAQGNNAPRLRSILCHKGYVIPLTESCVASHGEPLAAGVGGDSRLGGEEPPTINSYIVGATYHRDAMTEVNEQRHAENKAALEEILPGWMQGEATFGRSSIRATTPDRLPIIGAVDDGLYVATGYGSRGLLSAPLAAEMIASAIAGEISPVSKQLQTLTRPLRFKKA
jgi:tRNA 5-methylaminomethyl-2-thiouridine biosynthesis bifunctional protein